MSAGKQFLTVAEAADYLGSTPAYVRKLCSMRRLPHFKPNGGRLLFDVGELESYIRAGRIATADELADRACAILNGGAK